MIDQVKEIGESFNQFISRVFESEIISDREKALVALAAVIAFEDEKGMKNAILSAKQNNISNEEIGYVMSIIIALKSKKVAKLAEQDSCGCEGSVRCC